MAQLHSITPYRQAGRQSFVASFTDHTSKRVTRGLGTRDEGEARALCRVLEELVRRAPADIGAAPPGLPQRALELYFGRGAVAAGQAVVGHAPGELPALPVDLDRLAPAERALILGLQHQAAEALSELQRVRAERDQLRIDLEHLRASALARATEAARNCKSLPDSLAAYEAHMLATTSRDNATYAARLARKFAATLPPAVQSPAAITADQISSYLDAHAAKPGARKRLRRRLGRYINWAAATAGYPSQMRAVHAPAAGAERRERGPISWHELAVVERAIEQLPDAYWRALVGTLAYAGLRLNELIWLRASDLQPRPGGGHQLWITTVDDGHGARHELKTDRSERLVAVHATRLWPLLEAHLAAGAAGSGRAGAGFFFDGLRAAMATSVIG